MSELYDQLSEQQRLELDTLILRTAEENAVTAASFAAIDESNDRDAIAAARRSLRSLQNPDDLREEEIRNFVEFYRDNVNPGATNLEILQQAIASQRMTIDDRVRDGLQVSDADPVALGQLAYQNVHTPIVEEEPEVAPRR